MSWLSDWMGQDAAKKAGSLTDTAVSQAQQRYGDLGPYRQLGASRLTGTAPLTYSDVSSPLLTQSRGAAGDALRSLTSSPDYLAQAKSALADFDTASLPALAAARRGVKQDAATAGRIGSGGVTTSLGNLQGDYERNRMLTENDLIRGALDKAQQNKYQTLNAAEMLGGQEYGQGAADRAARNQVQQGNFNQGMGLAGLGFGYDPTNALFKGAGTYQDQSAANAAAFGGLIKSGAQLALSA